MPSLRDIERNLQQSGNISNWQLSVNFHLYNRNIRKLLSKVVLLREAYIGFTLLIFVLFVITLLITGELYTLKGDIEGLHSQIEIVKNEYDSQHFRRSVYHESINSSVRELSNDSTEEKRMDSVDSQSVEDYHVVSPNVSTLTPTVSSNQKISPSVSNRSVDIQNNTLHATASVILNNVTELPTNSIDPEKESLSWKTTIHEMQTRTNRSVIIEDDNKVDLRRELRARRTRRDERRGKKGRKNRRRPNRSRRRLDPLIATFIGAIPEQHITNIALIGPWIKSKDDSEYDLSKFHLVEKNMAIEITTNGLYIISSQISYFGEFKRHSYWILLNSEGKSATRKLVTCSATTSNAATEASCYTSITVRLQKGDRLCIQQQEQDRLINLQEGYSYIQLILLANDMQRKHST